MDWTRRIICILALLTLAASAQAQGVGSELETTTGKTWTMELKDLTRFSSADGDSAIAVGDSVWVAFGDTTWVRCATEPGPFSLDSLAVVADGTLRGALDRSQNGPLRRMATCIAIWRSYYESLNN